MLRYSRISGVRYLSSTAVFIAELLKLIICVVVVIFTHTNRGGESATQSLYRQIFLQWRDTIKLAVPAGLYSIQNNLLFFALSNLEAATYQIIYQSKILTTAMFSVLLLGKKLNMKRWLSLIVLMTGVIVVETTIEGVNHMDSKPEKKNQYPKMGLIAVALACLSSGFAGVYFEKILKGSKTTLWIRNIQLAIFGVISSFIAIFVNDKDEVIENGFFQGYNFIVLIVILAQAYGGLVIALVMKYADNIMKGFAVGLSIVINSILSVYIFDFIVTPFFVIGALLVITSMYVYGTSNGKSVKEDDKTCK